MEVSSKHQVCYARIFVFWLITNIQNYDVSKLVWQALLGAQFNFTDTVYALL